MQGRALSEGNREYGIKPEIKAGIAEKVEKQTAHANLQIVGK